MLFNSIQFLCFFPAVTAIYYILPHRFRYIFLLIASYGFYMCWNTRYALLMLCSTLITYRSGIALEKAVDTPPPITIDAHTDYRRAEKKANCFS